MDPRCCVQLRMIYIVFMGLIIVNPMVPNWFQPLVFPLVCTFGLVKSPEIGSTSDGSTKTRMVCNSKGFGRLLFEKKKMIISKFQSSAESSFRTNFSTCIPVSF